MPHSQRPRSSVIALRSLGDCAVDVDGKRIDPRSPVVFAALLRLLVEPSKLLARSEIQKLLWPDAPESEARHRLRQTVYTLKRAGIGLKADDVTVRLSADKITVDFRTAIANGSVEFRPLMKEFLPGYSPSVSLAFDGWLETLREQVNLQIRNALLTTISVQRQNGRWLDVEAVAARCLAIDPLNEEATLALAEARAMGGNKLAAVRLLESYREDLADQAAKIGLPGALLRERISDRLIPAESPLVGRESTIAAITTMVRHMGGGNGGGYLVTGAAGMGKTRIIEEVRRTAALTDITVVHTECLPSEAQCPLSVITKIVPEIQELPGAIGCSPSSLGYLRRLTDEPPDVSGDRSDHDAPSFVYAAVKRSILDLIGAVTHEVKLLIIIDDIDQADEQSTEVIADLVSASRSASLLVLMTARDPSGSVARLTNVNRGLRSHALQPLDRQESIKLLGALTSAHHGGLNEDQQCLYVEMARGNPLCIHELALYWESCGHLHPIPPSIESALNQRVANLTEDDLGALQAIAVLGRHANLKRLARLLAISKADLLSQTERLERLGFARWDLGVATCVHRAIGNLACAQLSSSASLIIHGKVAHLLRGELEPPRDSRMLWDCANHYRLAGLNRDAIALFTRCSDRLLKLGLPLEAASIWERALEWCQADDERVLVQEKLIPTLLAAGDLVRVSRTAEQIRQLRRALQLGDSSWSEWQIDVLEARMYALEDVEPILIEASACLADESTAPGTRVRAGICAMICAYNLHDAARLRHFNNLLLSIADEVTLRPADRLTISLIFNTYVGDLDLGATAGSDLVAVARLNGSLAFLAQCLRRHALALRMLGRFGDAQVALDEALQLAKSMGSRSYELATLTLIGQTLIEKGDLESARDLLDKAVTANDRRRFPYRAIAVAQLKAMIALITGNRREAIRVCDSRAFRKWRSHSNRSSGRIKHDSLAVSALLAVSKQTAGRAKKQLSAFDAEFSRLQGFGDQDFAAFALCKSWLAQGQTDRAQTTLVEYLRRHRRERYPAPTYLTSLLKPEHEQQATSSCSATEAP